MSNGSNERSALSKVPKDRTTTDWTLGLRTHIRMLPSEERRVIELRYFERKSHAEIAHVIGKPVHATQRLWSQAVARLHAMRHQQ